ncbi:hypothetical protein [Dyella japonica]|uniref:Tetratricopeptide repeat protein n=1 Tax=Dyella japonica TaxID=231455 RepID=A0ABV2JUN7_9GAMM
MAEGSSQPRIGLRMVALALLVTTIVYWPGLYGGWLFDDYPNIVDNKGIQPQSANLPSLITAALSSPASDLKRPLASLSFATNFLLTGLDPFWMKLSNLVIHLINGLLIFLVARSLTRLADRHRPTKRTAEVFAGWVASCWLLLPINLTGVLYVVQRMESLANVFVLLGLLGYIVGRYRMQHENGSQLAGLGISAGSLIAGTVFGLMAKETAIMLPLYAFLIESILLGFGSRKSIKRDRRVIALFVVTLFVPFILGAAWLAPTLLQPEAWATRDFNISTRLLTEARVVVDYMVWTAFPLPSFLSFYHDDYIVSTGLLSPVGTSVCLCILAALIGLMLWMKKRRPLASTGIALFLGAQLLTATILPLELVYEHRNYFASFGLLLTIVDLLYLRTVSSTCIDTAAQDSQPRRTIDSQLALFALLALTLWWTTATALTAYAWGDPLRLSVELANRGPDSPRAQYELGRTYIIYSGYDPHSPYTKLAYPPLERAARISASSILPLQALIFMNSRMHLPLDPKWWDTMATKLKERRPGVQDESSLGALAHCAADRLCDLPPQEMTRAFQAALDHPNPTARLLSMYGEYAWNVLDNKQMGLEMTRRASDGAPHEAVYLMNLIKMEIAVGELNRAQDDLLRLRKLSIGGSLDSSVEQLATMLANRHKTLPPSF